MVAKKGKKDKKANRKLKNLAVKGNAKTVKGGGLKLEGVKGESMDEKHKSWIEISS